MPAKYEDTRAHEVRARYRAIYGGDEFPVPVELIAADLFALRVEQSNAMDVSGMLLPIERRIVLNASEALHEDKPIRRQRFTIAHELGHWVCHCLEGKAPHLQPSYCRAADIAHDVDRALEREANVFAAELLMPEPAVRAAWSASADPAAVAELFGVSPLAAQWRLYGFGLAEAPPSA
jgi:Zn-dependent peptidase ImmA (M78 family)